MKPHLPRPLLWTEIQDMDRFLNEDFVNMSIYNVIVNQPTVFVSSRLDVVKMFNEMYYQMTRIYYEKPLPAEYAKFLIDMKANLGWSHRADMVMAMIYTYIRIKDKNCDIEINTFLKRIAKEQSKNPFFKIFQPIISTVSKWPPTTLDPKVPHPVSPKELASIYIDWKAITNNYNSDTIEEVINLWKNKDDREFVRNIINDTKEVRRIASRTRKDAEEEYKSQYKYIKELIESLKREEEEENNNILFKIVQECFKGGRNAALQSEIDRLNAENKRLNALLAKKKDATGKDRKFTLGQIVDYCKSCVKRDDAKDIVAMLNKFIRSNATDEDCELVDGIEEVFKKTTQGVTYNVAEMKKFENIGTYNDKVTEQNNNYPAPQLGGTQQKKIEK